MSSDRSSRSQHGMGSRTMSEKSLEMFEDQFKDCFNVRTTEAEKQKIIQSRGEDYVKVFNFYKSKRASMNIIYTNTVTAPKRKRNGPQRNTEQMQFRTGFDRSISPPIRSSEESTDTPRFLWSQPKPPPPQINHAQQTKFRTGFDRSKSPQVRSSEESSVTRKSTWSLPKTPAPESNHAQQTQYRTGFGRSIFPQVRPSEKSIDTPRSIWSRSNTPAQQINCVMSSQPNEPRQQYSRFSLLRNEVTGTNTYLQDLNGNNYPQDDIRNTRSDTSSENNQELDFAELLQCYKDLRPSKPSAFDSRAQFIMRDIVEPPCGQGIFYNQEWLSSIVDNDTVPLERSANMTGHSRDVSVESAINANISQRAIESELTVSLESDFSLEERRANFATQSQERDRANHSTNVTHCSQNINKSNITIHSPNTSEIQPRNRNSRSNEPRSSYWNRSRSGIRLTNELEKLSLLNSTVEPIIDRTTG